MSIEENIGIVNPFKKLIYVITVYAKIYFCEIKDFFSELFYTYVSRKKS